MTVAFVDVDIAFAAGGVGETDAQVFQLGRVGFGEVEVVFRTQHVAGDGGGAGDESELAVGVQGFNRVEIEIFRLRGHEAGGAGAVFGCFLGLGCRSGVEATAGVGFVDMQCALFARQMCENVRPECVLDNVGRAANVECVLIT